MNKLLQQLRQRRKALGLKQSDMYMRIGVSRQQYQQLETKGNPRLNTLELLAQGLESELLLVPNEKLAAVRAMLQAEETAVSPIADDPWRDILGEEL